MLATLPALVASLVLNSTRLGLNAVSLRSTDLATIDLMGRIAVFLYLPAGSFSADYRPTQTSGTHPLRISATGFTVTGWKITFRCLLRRCSLRFWLLDRPACPDLTNIALASTERMLAVETDLTGPLCVFASLTGSFYRATIGTDRGLPTIAFYSSRGAGRPVRTCRGEVDPCV
jgi:hypothetical protein